MARRRTSGRWAGLTFSRLLADYRRENNDKPNKRIHGHHAVHLERGFGRRLLHRITEQIIIDYGQARQNDGAPPGVINEELRSLVSIFQWAHHAGRLATIPRIYFVPDEAARAREEEQWLAWERRQSFNPLHGIPYQEHRGIPVRGKTVARPSEGLLRDTPPDDQRRKLDLQVLEKLYQEDRQAGAAKIWRRLKKLGTDVDLSTVSRALKKVRSTTPQNSL